MAKDFFSQTEQADIIRAIQQAENLTSGEIRVHVENRAHLHALDRAKKVFEELDMHKTKQRNGVLIYICTGKREFSILGDKGIHEKVGEQFWIEVRDVIQAQFKMGKFALGVADGIKLIGEKLAVFFPYSGLYDKNELPDNISIG